MTTRHRRQGASGLRDLLARIEERDRGRLGGPARPVGSDDLERHARTRQLDRQPDITDVALEPWRPAEVGHGAHRATLVERRPLLVELEWERLATDFDPDQLPAHATLADLLEGRMADVIGLLAFDQ